MDDMKTIVRAIVLFFCCLVIYKAVNIADEYVRYRIYRSHTINLNDMRGLDISEFFEEVD